MASNQPFFESYLESTKALVKSIVIKSEQAALSLNKYVTTEKRGTVNSDKSTWKYYLNLSGLPHATDAEMRVVSWDTAQEISFTRQALLDHTATAKQYRKGTKQHQQLVDAFPFQNILINGCLNPLNIGECIEARDGLILSYDSTLIQENEVSLISKIQDYIDTYRARWVNKQYNVSDNLYEATNLGILYASLVGAILSFREETAFTEEAHRYHVYQYLYSRLGPDVNLSVLNQRQLMTLYKNIDYYQAYGGRNEVFNELLDLLLIERGMRVYEYRMTHHVANLVEGLAPVPRLRKYPLNPGYQENVINAITPEIANALLTESTPDNALYENELNKRSDELMTWSPSNRLKTKFFETEVVVQNSLSYITLADQLLSEWLDLAGRGIYQAVVAFEHPITGEILQMTMADAYVLMWYCWVRGQGIVIDEVPQFYAVRARLMNPPTAEALFENVDHTYLKLSDVQAIIDMNVPIGPIMSTSVFNVTATAIHTAAMKQILTATTYENINDRSMMDIVAAKSYSDSTHWLVAEGTTYDAWLASKNIDLSMLNKDQLALIALDLTSKATNVFGADESFIRTLNGLLAITRRLVSYSVQFYSRFINIDTTPIPLHSVHIGDVIVVLKNKISLGDNPTPPGVPTQDEIDDELENGATPEEIKDLLTPPPYLEGYGDGSLLVGLFNQKFKHRIKQELEIPTTILLDVKSDQQTRDRFQVNSATVRVQEFHQVLPYKRLARMNMTDFAIKSPMPVLTQAQINSIRSIYSHE